MEIGELFGDSFDYTKEALIDKWMRWILLIISAIIFPLLAGYLLAVLRGEKPAPEPENWIKLLIDGIIVLIIGFIYSIPVFIIATLTMGTGMYAIMANPYSMGAGAGFFGIGMLLTCIAAIIISLIANIAIIRYARTEKIEESFNFKEIIEKIHSLGWVDYFIKIFVLSIAIGILVFVVNIIPIIGFLIYIALLPAIAIFSSRYLCLIYDSA
ncbi:DUF4013 domain-containing protein [Methanoplanus sp. FWC-SCC4]|uniref:DUF4013 domain-containing protein n=1 Tax=Methanochimaera problematica TaxID=2609417 RepID=A0AA97I2K4_9EURY|nr:DUF4013 domain-containing protein [Methanoplanus sp. FWC-SCC4]WOF15703.1 DUF4013 domain-containing protein [Methanoplanus sp. FWC-SCC4]